MIRIDRRRSAIALMMGAVSWLVGAVFWQVGGQFDSDAPVAGRVALGLGSVLIGLGALFGLARLVPPGAARVGAAMSGVTVILAGLSLAIGTFGGLVLGYTCLLYLHPIGLLVLGIGLIRGGGSARWMAAVPLAMFGVALLTYAYRANSPDIWEPPELLLFTATGLGWLLLGVWTARSISTARLSTSPVH